MAQSDGRRAGKRISRTREFDQASRPQPTEDDERRRQAVNLQRRWEKASQGNTGGASGSW